MATQNANPGIGAQTTTDASSEALRLEGVRNEKGRQSAIRANAAPFASQLGEQFVASLIDTDVPVEEANRRILTQLALRDAAQPHTASGHIIGRDTDEMRIEAMTAALLHRYDARKYPIVNDCGREFVGFKLLDYARACLEARGERTRGLNADRIALSALTTSDLPNLVSNLTNKTLREGYQATPRTFTEFARQVSAADFKPINRIQVSDLAALQPLNEQGEFKHIAMTDSKQSYSLATYGNIVAVTRKTVINDDLEGLTRIPFAFGVAAAQLESNTVWAVITGNQVMGEDGNALFHALHSNLLTGSGSALSITALAAARGTLRMQKGPKGTFLNLIPSFLITPTSLETAALQLIAPINLVATTDPTKVIPEWVRTLTPVVEPRLDAASTKAWYLACRPGLIDTIEYCYLEGQDGVYMENKIEFGVDGFQIKARLDFGAAAIDYRGLQMNAGQ
jgi:hypothetical protein